MAGPRRRRWLWVLLTLIVVCAVLVAADRATQHVAESRTQTRLQQKFHLSDRPSVDIRGFPFLTQVVMSRFDHVVITADDADIAGEGGRISLQHLALDLHDVRVRQGGDRVEIGQLSGSATIAWSEISRLGGQHIEFDHTDPTGQGWIKVSGEATVAKRKVPVQIVARPVLDVRAQTITLADPSVTVLGSVRLPRASGDLIVSQLVGAIPLTLPVGATGSRLTAGPDGATIHVNGTALMVGGP